MTLRTGLHRVARAWPWLRSRRVSWRRLLRGGVALLLVLVVAAVVVRVWPRPSLSEAVPLSTVVRDREGRLLRLTLASDQRYRLWVPLEDIPPQLVDAVMLQEDAWFRWHPGFNPWSLLRGAWSTYGSGEARVGGSTLTMQLARLRWRLQTRDMRGKFVQILRAVQLELCHSKDEILEAYLNLAPYGGNIEGVGAASLIYYRKPASRLTLPESLALAVLPQAPSRRGRLASSEDAYYIGRGLEAARTRLYARWRAQHPDDPASDALMRLPLRLHSPRELPFRAPHLVDRVLADRAWHRGDASELVTTLDLRLQRLLEERLRNHLQRERSRGLRNASAILVDTRDMSVRAMVGSADYFDAAIQGQVNGAEAKRSPGSTLKPFIYALAFDQGVLHPQTVLRDVPSAFGPYTPENFDGRFMGPVTATDALVRSRNIPAVHVASRLRQPDFHDFLRQAGVSRMASREHYGLALVLGGGEVTMVELARLYAMLGNDGRLRALRWRQDDAVEDGVRLISAEAAFMTRDMLRQNPRPDAAAQPASHAPPVSWKTGTSWAFRDAWSAGIVGSYAVVVWLGNFDGASNPALVGVEAAAPLFFDIVDGLQAAGVDLREPVREWPLNLKRVEICRASGDLPNAWCPQRGMTWFIPGKSPIRISTVHRAVSIDKASGRPACGRFDPATMRMEVFEYWPSDLAQVFVQAGIPRRRPPAGSDCGDAQAWLGSAPAITSPYRATRYTRRLSDKSPFALVLAATADADATRLFWFAGNTFIGTAEPGKALSWTPDRAGHFRLSVVDDRGRADEREIEVAVVQ